MKVNQILWQILLSLTGIAVHAAEDPARLGRDLTSVGAEVAGNKDGSIPAWTGASPFNGTWSKGSKRSTAFKYQDDKILFSINAGNIEKYADKLPVGIASYVRQSKAYQLDVYPTRRTCGVPDFVAENVKKNTGVAKVGADGWSLQEAVLPGAPFPLPADGVQVLWNTKMRYRGLAIHFRRLVSTVSPRTGSNDWIRATQNTAFFFPWGVKGSQALSKLPKFEYQVYSAYESPVALAGQAMVFNVSVDQPGSEVFYYFPGQRRVRRMPSYAYDAPQIGFENQYLVDEPSILNGTIDRYTWKLAGKKELYVPYNSFSTYDYSANQDEVITKTGISAPHRRYELHRVWVVEGALKSGTRHVSSRKTLYVDEDSWAIVAGEDYDAQGVLWKAKEAYTMPVAEIGACDAPAFVQFNLLEGRFVLDNHALASGRDMEWTLEAKEPTDRGTFYNADNLRSISDR